VGCEYQSKKEKVTSLKASAHHRWGGADDQLTMKISSVNGKRGGSRNYTKISETLTRHNIQCALIELLQRPQFTHHLQGCQGNVQRQPCRNLDYG